jgi:hypothetical protein
MSINLKIEIDSQPVPADSVYFREFKYGGPSFGYPVKPYQLSVNMHELVAALELRYQEYADDDREYRSSNASRLDLELRRLRWPPLPTLAVTYPNVLTGFLMENAYLVLQELFGVGQDSKTHFVINSVVSVHIEHSIVIFSGEAVATSRPGAT